MRVAKSWLPPVLCRQPEQAPRLAGFHRMKLRIELPTDLLMVLLVPFFAVTVIGVVAGYALRFLQWLLAHR